MPAYKLDLEVYAWWSNAAAENGLHAFYDAVPCDYPPFSIYIFWVLGSLAKRLSLFETELLVYLIKLPPNLFDTATAFLIFSFVRKHLDFNISLLTVALYAFNPAVIFNAAVWGQYDAIYTFFLVLSLVLILASKPKLSAVAFILGLLTKPQSIALAPLIAFLILRKHGWRSLLASLLVAAATIFVVIIPFKWSNPITFLTDIYFGQAYAGYEYTTVNAFNLWALGGFLKPDSQAFLFLNFLTIGWIMFGALAVFALYVLHKGLQSSGDLLILFSAFILFFGFFMLPTRIHERYLFPALSILALMVPFIRKVRPIYGALSFTCLVNQAYVSQFLINERDIEPGDPVVLLVTLLNIVVFLYALTIYWRKNWNKFSPVRRLANAHWKVGSKLQINKRDLFTMAVLSIVFFSVATWNLGMTRVPLTTWQASGNQSFYIDLGRLQSVDTAYLLVKNGSSNLQVYTGSPGNWTENGVTALEGYYSWNEIKLDRDVRYLKFDFHQASIEIAEMVVLGKDSQKLVINAITGEGTPAPDLHKLIDEQELVQIPPTYASETFFDEIYYVRTAENYLKLQQAYEWTHPPLGKLIIASGILVFGYNPFGWRIMGVIFATLMIPFIYVLGKKLFGTWIGASASAFLLTFDFMHFTMARMATVDTYVVFFSLASQLFFLIYLTDVVQNGWKASVLPLLLSVLFFALGFSTKWIVLFGFVGQLAILLALRLKEVIKLREGVLSVRVKAFFGRPFFLLLMFLVLAIFIYFLTYIPDMLAGSTLVDVFQLQGYMLAYHSTLTAHHPFASQWWTWPLIRTPVWLFSSDLPGNIVSTLVLMGNPAVWWVGFVFVILAVEVAIRRRDFACIFITVLFFFQWLSYIFISRDTFLYHFYVNVPFLCLALAYFLNEYWSRKWGKAAALAYFTGVVILFALFYPAISGTPVLTSWIDSLKWFESWVF